MLGYFLIIGYWIVIGLVGYRIIYEDSIELEGKTAVIIVCGLAGPAVFLAGLIKLARTWGIKDDL